MGRWGSHQTCCNWVRPFVSVTSHLFYLSRWWETSERLNFHIISTDCTIPLVSFLRLHTLCIILFSLSPTIFFLTSFNLMLCIKEPSIHLCFIVRGENILSISFSKWKVRTTLTVGLMIKIKKTYIDLNSYKVGPGVFWFFFSTKGWFLTVGDKGDELIFFVSGRWFLERAVWEFWGWRAH